mmetsp:Transcript_37137/g.87045  ORF Transcript_37137/g.87045 Transcript_37137/m.87045 type:complete len:458 (+) Transcript_37137:106-1479(+)
MFGAFRRGVRLTGRIARPAGYAGAGYLICVVQNRDETALELAAAGCSSAWASLMQGVRSFEASLPAFATAFRDPLLRLEAKELSTAMKWIRCCEGRELDCPALQQAILLHICQLVQEDARAPAVLALAHSADEEDGSHSSESSSEALVSILDNAVCKLDVQRSAANVQLSEFREAPLLEPLAACLQAIAESDECWEELGTSGALKLTRTALIVSTWLATDRQLATASAWQPSLASKSLEAEEAQAASKALEAAWHGIARHKAFDMVRKMPWSRRTAEVGRLQRDIRLRATALEQVRLTPPGSLSQPLQNFLPGSVRSRVRASYRRQAAAPVESTKPLEVDEASAPPQLVEGGDVKQEVAPPARQGRSSSAWLLVGGVLLAVALGQDGAGVLPWQIPPAVKEATHTALQRCAISVEEQMSKDAESMAEEGDGALLTGLGPIILGSRGAEDAGLPCFRG